MKILIISLFSLTFCQVFGQLPFFDSNVSSEEQETSIVYQKFHLKYSAAISYTQSSFWFKKHEYYVFVFDKSDWTLIKWSFELSRKKKIIRQKIKSIKLDTDKWDKLLVYFQDAGFYCFNQDSLNLNRRENPDGSALVQVISDGATDHFEMYSGPAHRVSYASNAEARQQFVGTLDRENFIECKKRIMDLVSKSR